MAIMSVVILGCLAQTGAGGGRSRREGGLSPCAAGPGCVATQAQVECSAVADLACTRILMAVAWNGWSGVKVKVVFPSGHLRCFAALNSGRRRPGFHIRRAWHEALRAHARRSQCTVVLAVGSRTNHRRGAANRERGDAESNLENEPAKHEHADRKRGGSASRSWCCKSRGRNTYIVKGRRTVQNAKKWETPNSARRRK